MHEGSGVLQRIATARRSSNRSTTKDVSLVMVDVLERA